MKPGNPRRDSWTPADKGAEIDNPTEFPREPRNVERGKGPVLVPQSATTGKKDTSRTAGEK